MCKLHIGRLSAHYQWWGPFSGAIIFTLPSRWLGKLPSHRTGVLVCTGVYWCTGVHWCALVYWCALVLALALALALVLVPVLVHVY